MAFKESRVHAGVEPDETPTADTWLSKLNAFGEKNARVVITLSTILVILIVVIIGVLQSQKAEVERAEKELREARTTEELKKLKEKYGNTPVGPRISQRLANLYYEKNSLSEAEAEYADFLNRWPNDPLTPFVIDSQASLKDNMKYEREMRPVRLKMHELRPHPQQLPGVADAVFRADPPPHAGSEVSLALPDGTVLVRLFEDEAPLATADFLKRCDAGEFNDRKIAVVDDGKRFEVLPAEGGKAAGTLPREKNSRPAVEGALILVPEGDANAAGRFQILLKDLPDLKGVTVFGEVLDGLSLIKSPAKDATLRTVGVPYRRPGS